MKKKRNSLVVEAYMNKFFNRKGLKGTYRLPTEKEVRKSIELLVK